MPDLEENTRHSERNDQARQRAADQLRPAMRKLLAETFEVSEDEIPLLRDAIKQVMAARARREERKNQTVLEVIKWGVGVLLGGLGTWIATHQGNGR